MLGDGLGDSQSHAGEGFEMTPTAFTRLESAYESHCARLYGEYLDQLDENEARADIEQAFWDALNFNDIGSALADDSAIDGAALSAPCRKAIRKRYSTCSSAPFKSTSNNARSRNTNGAKEKPKNANRSCVMNKCAASADEVTTCLDFAFRSSEIIRLLRRLRDACGAEQIGETHQAVIKADLNRAIQSVMRANTEFRQNFRREEQQLTRSDG